MYSQATNSIVYFNSTKLALKEANWSRKAQKGFLSKQRQVTIVLPPMFSAPQRRQFRFHHPSCSLPDAGRSDFPCAWRHFLR